MNHQWKRTGRQFQLSEYERLHKKYWENHSTKTIVRCIQGEDYRRLIQLSKESQLTVNTLITAALCKAAMECGEKGQQDIGQAVSIRNPGYEGMGNFATGISIQMSYRDSISFVENARMIQDEMRKKLTNPKKKYFLLHFMGQILGSLQDAVYYCAVEGYENKTVKTFCSML